MLGRYLVGELVQDEGQECRERHPRVDEQEKVREIEGHEDDKPVLREAIREG